MSAPGLTSEAQLRYLLQWFGEFSELQREDFLPILSAARSGKPDLLAASLVNLSCEDKPVSLFQCRIKLFNEWYPTWAEEEQDRLVKGVTETDPDFGEKLNDMILNGPPVNGDFFGEHNGTNGTNGTDETHSIEEEPEKEQAAGESHEDIDNDPPIEAEPAVVQENIPVEIAAAS